jgi:hypothetical protein
MSETEWQLESYVQRWVPSSALKHYGYGNLCPIVPVWREVHQNVADLTEPRRETVTWNGNAIDDNVLLDAPPGFLILYLAGIDPDPSVETSALLVRDSMKALFHTCGDALPIHYEKIRTALEVRLYMDKYRFQYSHVVLIGHGSESGISLLDIEGPVARDEFAKLLGCTTGCRQVEVISFCCHSGCEEMASALSTDASIRSVIAPNGAFDMRWAAVFVQSYLLKTFDEGLSPEQAVASIKFDQPMCVWSNGRCHPC